LEGTITSKVKIATIVIVIILIAVALGGFLIVKKDNSSVNLSWNDHGAYAKATCTFDKDVLVGQESEFQIVVNAIKVLGNTTITTNVSDNLSIIGENINWTGYLNDGNAIKLFLNLTATKTGYCEIRVRLIYENMGMDSMPYKSVFFAVSENQMVLNSKFENSWYNQATGLALLCSENNEMIKTNVTLSETPRLDKEFTIRYNISSSIDLLDSDSNYIFINFPPNGFNILNVDFPEGGTKYHSTGEAGIEYSWKGAIRKNETYQVTAQLMIFKEGEGTIDTSLRAQTLGGITDTTSISLHIDRYNSNYSVQYSAYSVTATP
jgi:hypothetical protein